MAFFFLGALVILVVAFIVWDIRRTRRRKESLYQDHTGAWVWIDHSGEERRSDTHPEEPGGEWYSDGSGDGGDGGGGDGGGGD
ncbi:hypothetical protein [Roseobacter sp. SK209-2-6]|uniref:hypothetical protein n=1 Tax=Roseobacter sp. SK209-2-6 TaxID=388739 RepID=UPI0012F50435|nr:hypothetical protein [Roseobacter sp. SK209-2-6]